MNVADDDIYHHNESPKRKPVKKSEALWLMSFSDMSLVLLCFFVLMIASMKPDKDKFKHIKESMTASKESKNINSITSVTKNLTEKIKSKQLDQNVTVVLDTNGLQIDIKDQILFQPGSARLNLIASKVFQDLAKILNSLDQNYHITVEGHTDDTPLKGSSLYPSNWELSASRGISVMKQLHINGINKERMSVEAFADTRPKVPINGLTGRFLMKARQTNRRVVIRVD